jgi:hypothetical protein
MDINKIVACPILVLSAAGIFVCTSIYLLAITGIYQLPAGRLPLLFVGMFVVWLPTVILMHRLNADFKQKDLWKAALRGCPAWMRTALWIVGGCAAAGTFLVPTVLGRGLENVPQSFALFIVTFYAISFCVMYSVINVEKFDASRRCLNGHTMSPLAKFCEECGAPVAVDAIRP